MIDISQATDNEIALLTYALESFLDEMESQGATYWDEGQALFKAAWAEYKKRDLYWEMFENIG